MTNLSKAGGPAMAGGQRFQAQVTAWWCTHILLQTPLGDIFDLLASSIAGRIYCETIDSIDDIRVEFSGNGQIFGQCKRSLTLSRKVGSRWSEVLIQFYNELKRITPVRTEGRFVLFYERSNYNLVRLGKLLDRYRQRPDGEPLLDIAVNQSERNLLENLNNLLDTLQKTNGLLHLTERREELLRHIYIKQLNLGVDGADYLSIKNDLRTRLLTHPKQANQVLTSFHRLADDLIADRGSSDRLALRKRLKDEEILLQDSPDYRPDFKRLEDWSVAEITNHEVEKRSKLIIAEHEVSISRPVVQEMLNIARTTSFIVVGDAGTGKTGCLLILANKLRASNDRVWYWAADSLPYHSPQEIGTHLKLQYPWEELFSDAASGAGGTLIIDGLDGLRDIRAQRAYRKLFLQATRCGINVIASIRSFDLRYAVDLQEIFASGGQSISLQFSSGEFKKVNHIVIPELNDAEFKQVISQFPLVQTVLGTSPQLRPVVRNLFSLDLLCKLIADGDSATQLSSISTQAELFERYWARRINSHELREEMTSALRQLIEQMVDQQTLQIIPEGWSGQVKNTLFSSGLVRYPPSIPGRIPEQELVEFSHHLLFDYAAELLFVRPRRKKLAVELAPTDTWGLFLRPSLVLFFRYAWYQGRNDFWDTLIELEQSSISSLHKLPGHLVVAEEAISREDLQPLLEGSLRNDSNGKHWIQITQGVVNAAIFSSLPKLLNSSSGDWWVEFACDLINSSNSQLVYIGRGLLFSASDALENLSTQARLFLNQAAVMLVKFHWNEGIQPSHIVRPAIEWVCRTIDSDFLASSEIIRKVLTHNELQRAGYIQGYGITNHIEDIWQADSTLAVEIYDAIFGYIETDRSATSFGNSDILPLRSNRRQDYEHIYYQLSEKFPKFLSAYPGDATLALIRVIRHLWNQEHSWGKSPQIETFTWNGRECSLQLDYSHIWDKNTQYPNDQIKILHVWEDYLAMLPKNCQANEKWNAISDVLVNENELAAVWRRLLSAASRAPEFYAQRLWTILLNTTILASLDTQNTAENCIRAFVPYLPDKAVRSIETRILDIDELHFPDGSIETDEKYLCETKAQLLLCVPEERLGAAAEEFLARPGIRLIEPRQQRNETGATFEAVTTEELLAMKGTDITVPKHKELLQISDFLEKLSSDNITNDNSKEILQKILLIENTLTESHDEIDDRVASTIQQRLIYGFAQIACSKATLHEKFRTELYERFRDNLISQVEVPSLKRLQNFDRFQSWPSFDARVNAAEGFMCLTVNAEELSNRDKDLLRYLANDPEPDVRFQLGPHIWLFLNRWPEFVWETVEHWISELPQAGILGVLQGTLHSSWFWWLRNDDKTRADQLLRDLLTAVRLCDSKELRNACGTWLAALCFFEDTEWACETISSAISSIEKNLDELEGVQHVAINELLPRAEKEPIPVEKHQKALNSLLKLLRTANEVFETYLSNTKGLSSSDQPKEPPPWLEQVFHFFYNIATEFQFSVQGHAKQWATVQQVERDAKMAAWWETSGPILEVLLLMPYPSVTFHLIEGLENLVSLDVQRTLHWLRRATLASVPMGLTNESLAADHTIGILERILAEHRASLAVGSETRSDFVQILEAYLQAGWPRATRLAVQLESIFR